MSKIWKKVYNRIIVSAICLLLAVVLVMPQTAKADDHTETVRVGYYENEVFQEGAKVVKGLSIYCDDIPYVRDELEEWMKSIR